MTEEWSVPAWAVLAVAGLLLLLTVLLLVSAAGRRRAEHRHARDLHEARAETARLRTELAALQQRLAEQTPKPSSEPGAPEPVRAEPEFVITGLSTIPTGPTGPTGPGSPPDTVPVVAPRLFADVVAREAVIQVASLVHGLRLALSAESRNRIRFEMKREVKRSRKQRKADLRAARREWEARQREELSA